VRRASNLGVSRSRRLFYVAVSAKLSSSGVVNEEKPIDFRIEGLDSLIFANRKLEGMRLIREQLGCELSESLRIYSELYKQLRTQDPAGFNCTHEQYWEGFHS